MSATGLVPIEYERHAHRFWRRFVDFSFARKLRQSPIVAAEAGLAAAAFPILFQCKTKQFSPVILLSLFHELDTPFVSTSGIWRAAYVPTSLRCHPFSTGTNCRQRQDDICLMVDESSGLISDDPADEPFFQTDGALAPELEAVRAFFKSRERAVSETEHICNLINEAGLFVPAHQHDGLRLPHALFGIDTLQLNTLSPAHLSLLMKSGALAFIHAHQISLAHCKWLWHAQYQSGSNPQRLQDSTETETVRFLGALAEADPEAEDLHVFG